MIYIRKIFKKSVLIFILFVLFFTLNNYALEEKTEKQINNVIEKINKICEKKGENFRFLLYKKIEKFYKKRKLKGEKKEIIEKILNILNSDINNSIQTFSYSFPDGGYKGLQKRSKYNLPAKFNGLISYPKESGKYPIVFVIHGGSPDCMWKGKSVGFNPLETYTEPWLGVCPDSKDVWYNLPKGIENPYKYFGPDYSHNYMGMAYLVNTLAKKGMIAVSVDTNIQSNVWLKKGFSNGLENVEAVVKKHYKLLKDINIGKNHGLNISDLKGKIDFENVAIIGHSNGGVASYYIASEQKLPNIKSLVLLEAGGYTTEPNVEKKLINTLVLRGSCDEQLGKEAGLYLAEELKNKGKGDGIIYDILVNGIGHGDLNTLWSGNNCKGEKKYLNREKTEEVVSSIVSSFLNDIFYNKEYIIEVPLGVSVKLRSIIGKEPEIKSLEETNYKYISPKLIKRIYSKENILGEFPPKDAIGQG